MISNCLDLSLSAQEASSSDSCTLRGFYPKREERIQLSKAFDEMYVELIPQLAKGFNAYHGEERSDRYWEVLIGPFLKRYLRVMMNRALTLEQTLQNSSICRVHLDTKPAHYVAQNTLSFIELVDLHQFSERVYFDLAKDFYPDLQIEFSENNESDQKKLSLGSDAGNESQSSKKQDISRVLLFIQSLFSGGKVYIHDMYASKKLKLLSHVLNGQFPRLVKRSVPLQVSEVEERQNFMPIQCVSSSRRIFHAAIEKYFFRHVPRCFVEDYKELVSSESYAQFPSSPKIIVTSTAFDTDEYFKAWLADQLEHNAQYIVLQHGAVYGTNPFFQETVEERTSDSFLTWGWAKAPNHKKTFCFNTAYDHLDWKRESEALLFVQIIKRRNKFIWDTEIEYASYMNDQIEFVENLDKSMQENVIVRLYRAYKRRCPNQKSLLQSASSYLKFDEGERDFQELVRESRLVLFAYESSGFLELLSLDFPVIAFWDNEGFDQHHNDLDQFYSLLVDAKILHKSGESAAKFVNYVWDDVDEWWGSESVVEARNQFVEQFAAKTKSPASNLNKILREHH